jgi:hypothetical protein
MAKFRVMIEGSPLFLVNEETNQLQRLGFFTTRWVRADSTEGACDAAQKLVIDELAVTGNRNPADQPLNLAVSEVVQLSWAAGLRHWRSGGGFTLYPDDSN